MNSWRSLNHIKYTPHKSVMLRPNAKWRMAEMYTKYIYYPHRYIKYCIPNNSVYIYIYIHIYTTRVCIIKTCFSTSLHPLSNSHKATCNWGTKSFFRFRKSWAASTLQVGVTVTRGSQTWIIIQFSGIIESIWINMNHMNQSSIIKSIRITFIFAFRIWMYLNHIVSFISSNQAFKDLTHPCQLSTSPSELDSSTDPPPQRGNPGSPNWVQFDKASTKIGIQDGTISQWNHLVYSYLRDYLF